MKKSSPIDWGNKRGKVQSLYPFPRPYIGQCWRRRWEKGLGVEVPKTLYVKGQVSLTYWGKEDKSKEVLRKAKREEDF